MALVTVDAVVNIPVHVLVMEVGGVVVAMTSRALEDRVVTTINVARGALAVCVAMTGGKSRVIGMRERATGPIGSAHAVTRPALCNREERDVRGRGMGWVGGPVVVALMA